MRLPVRATQFFKGTLRCGKLSFFTHWTPPAMLGACELHEDCYTTAPLLGSVTEHELVAWIGEAPSFQNGSAHMSTLPSGCYKHRGVTSAKITQLWFIMGQLPFHNIWQFDSLTAFAVSLSVGVTQLGLRTGLGTDCTSETNDKCFKCLTLAHLNLNQPTAAGRDLFLAHVIRKARSPESD